MDAASMETMNMTYLPLSNPLCNNDTCLAFETAHLASQAQISWLSQFEYGKWVTYYYCGFIGIFAIHYIYRTITDRIVHNRPKDVRRTPTLMDRKIALGRSLTYRRLSGRIGDSLGLPSLGLTAFILLSILFALLLTFVQHPYYRLRRGFGSPPLGVRAGMAGTALTPLVFALAGKYNLVTLLTGISHEKLNTLHRWVSYIYLFFGIAHTVPFLVADLSDGGTKRLHYQFYYDGRYLYIRTHAQYTRLRLSRLHGVYRHCTIRGPSLPICLLCILVPQEILLAVRKNSHHRLHRLPWHNVLAS